MIQYVSFIKVVPLYSTKEWLITHNDRDHIWPHEERPSLKEIAQLLEREHDAEQYTVPDGTIISISTTHNPPPSLCGSVSSNNRRLG